MGSIARGVGLLLVIVGVLVAVPLAPLQAQPQPAGIGALTWLAGSWAGSDGRNDHEEHWTAPKGAPWSVWTGTLNHGPAARAGLTGILMCGLSTAFFFAVVSRMSRHIGGTA
jgi:hypothetical protein